MENTISELYSKYTEQVGGALEEDRYFQYLFEMVQAGNNTLQQKHRVLHKVVDERWLGVVEEGIQSIFNIVDKPRRFITTSEEIVPVALARKITADSVRHLSQHTEFITTDAAGEIQPTKILNVTTEESYDLYENRFIYHLIQRLFAFVDKRTDVIFWATGDETCNIMSMESKVDDAYEEISYKVEMTIKNRQSYEENDTDNMDLFKRIDRVRRLSRTLRTSSFCEIMNGCAKVRSPIQRTNLMMKDPDYRACYQLWQFIESYDEVGYTIEEQDSALQFDEEYLLQMYINLITNYTVFKSLLESDPRKMSEIAVEKREPVKPRFIKEIKEEIVDDYNIPDVEVRKVIIEEVTQAQLDAEAKLEEEQKRREELERQLSEQEWQIDSLNQQLDMLEESQAQLEEEKNALEGQLVSEQLAAGEKLKEERRARKEAEEAKEAADLEARKAMDAVRKEAEEAMKSAEQEKNAAIESAEQEKNTAIQAAEQEKLAAVRKAEEEKEAALKKAEVSAKEKETAQKAAEKADREAKEAVEAARREAEEAVEAARREAEEAVEAARREAEEAVSEAERKAAEAVERAGREAEETVRQAVEKAEETVKSAKKEAEERVGRAEKEAEAATGRMEKAEAKAQANSLSHYIVKALQKRQERKNTKEDEK